MGQYDRKRQSQPKHGKPSDSGASKAPPPLTRGLPGWKGPGYIHKKKSAASPAASKVSDAPKVLEHSIPLELEQLMLDVFRATFPAASDFEALKPTLQKVKDALLQRDLDTAFESEEHLEAYAIRWSPSRSLCYAQLLAWICAEGAENASIQRLIGSDGNGKTAKIVCFGGDAAELMAFSVLLRYLQPLKAAGKPATPAAGVSDSSEATSIAGSISPAPVLQLTLLNTPDWTSVLSKLVQGLQAPPTLSKYASAAARAKNASFLAPGAVERVFTRTDMLDCSTENFRTAIGTESALLTLMFTLNELYMMSMPRTTAFLRRLTEATPSGSLLLVVDTPGAYSEVTMGNGNEGDERRKCLMSQLLDYALVPRLAQGQEVSDEEKINRPWEKVTGEANMAYRLDSEFKYPVSLENMRIQVHLFRRL